MKLCNKCGNQFPIRIKIDGKWRNLASRKFCLDCSPFGVHNTRNLTKESSRRQHKGKRKPYGEWSESDKDENRARTFWRGFFRKQKLVEIKGNKCQKCGYKRCLRSLSFHHRNPTDKSFSLDARTIQSKTWTLVLEEVDKCDLLCLNCHMEMEDAGTEYKYAAYKDLFYENYSL